MFTYQEVASLAREGARYGSTHGRQYRIDAGLPIGTQTDWQSDIVQNGINPKLVALPASSVNVVVTYPDVINQPGKPDNWPGSQVAVTVSYTWMPGIILRTPIVLQSTSAMPITN